MCGIIAVAARAGGRAGMLGLGLDALAHRGPDADGISERAGVTLGHRRLSIQDPQARSDQPFSVGPVTISYNGELFNAQQIRAEIDAHHAHDWQTTGDTEVIAAALAYLDTASALAAMDGMFAIAWADERTPGMLHLARDRHGEIPLHLHRQMPPMAASELKAFTAAGRRCGNAVVDVTPGEHWQVHSGGGYGPGIGCEQFARITAKPRPWEADEAAEAIGQALGHAVDTRMISDVPICTLLSGGIDSAIIAAELAARLPDLTCYTAVMDRRSRDLAAARMVADQIGAKLVEVTVDPPSSDDLAATIGHIEMPHKAQVEIAWPCLALAEAIAGDGFKVTYSGEGSDELWASYGFAYHGTQAHGWFGYRRDLIATQARKNFPRVNKAFMTAGVEARLPFLNPAVVDLALSMPRAVVADGSSRPKAILARAYEDRLPGLILRRAKLAFQDGLGIKADIATRVARPAAFYQAEYGRRYG